MLYDLARDADILGFAKCPGIGPGTLPNRTLAASDFYLRV